MNNKTAIVIGLVISSIALSLLITMALVYGICWAFDWTYSHKIAVGVWLITIFAQSLISGGRGE